jgi:hypothetical protein
MAVFTTSSGPYRALAEDIAADANQELCTSLETALDSSEPVTYVDPPEKVSEDELLSLQSRLLRRGPEDGGFGIVTGYTVDAARSLYFDRQPSDGHAVLLEKSVTGDPEIDADTVLIDDELTATRLEELADSRLESFSIDSHGWSIHLDLPDGYLCGYPRSESPAEYDTDQPVCVVDGEMDCPFDEEIVRAEDVRANHLFVSSCASVIDNNLQGLPVHLGFGLLSGADSLIGSYRPSVTLPVESIFHYCLLRDGYGLSERVYLQTQFSETNDLMSDSYIAFGHPRAELSESNPGTATVEYEREDDGVAVSCSDIEGHVLDVTLPSDALSAETDKYYVRDRSESSLSPLYYVAFEDRGRVRVVAFTGSRFDGDSLELLVAPTPTASIQREIATQALENAGRARNMNLLNSKAEKQYDGLWNQVRDFPTKVFDERYIAGFYDEATDEVTKPFGHVSSMEDELVELAEGGKLLVYTYHNRAVEDDVFRSTDECHYCGRPVFVRQVSDGHRTRRAIGNCSRCGVIYDVPTTDGETAPTHPVVDVGEPADDGTTPAVISFENDGDTRQRVKIVPFVEHEGTAIDDAPVVDPETAFVRLDPGERVEQSFTIDESLIDEFRFRLGVQVIANLSNYVGMMWFRTHPRET